MSDVNCPYCGAGQEICHDDGYGYDENETYEQECRSCDKVFAFSTRISFYHEAWRADCLNGSEHKYRPTLTVPRDRTKMECEECGDRRECSESEMADLMKH